MLNHARNPGTEWKPSLPNTYPKGWSESGEGNPEALEADKTDPWWPQETQGKAEKGCLDGVGKSHSTEATSRNAEVFPTADVSDSTSAHPTGDHPWALLIHLWSRPVPSCPIPAQSSMGCEGLSRWSIGN